MGLGAQMRVQETKPTGKATIMGKKKHKLRKQAKENELCPSDSSDEGINPGNVANLSQNRLNPIKLDYIHPNVGKYFGQIIVFMTSNHEMVK